MLVEGLLPLPVLGFIIRYNLYNSKTLEDTIVVEWILTKISSNKAVSQFYFYRDFQPGSPYPTQKIMFWML